MSRIDLLRCALALPLLVIGSVFAVAMAVFFVPAWLLLPDAAIELLAGDGDQ